MEEENQGITAYHGSPHDFEQFDIGQIGTGEGAQAFGHGLYFAEAEPVAKDYREKLSSSYLSSDKGNIERRKLFEDLSSKIQESGNLTLSQSDAIAMNLIKGIEESGSLENFVRTHEINAGPKGMFRKGYETGYDFLKNVNPKPHKGHMYEVGIDAHPDHFLDWDKPLRDQPEIIRRLAGWSPEHEQEHLSLEKEDTDALLAALEGDGNYTPVKMPRRPAGALSMSTTGSDVYEHFKNKMGAIDWPVDADSAQRREYRDLAAKKATDYLLSHGIKGIKYLDRSSRAAGEGSRNYVVFDDKLVNVKRKYEQGGEVEGYAHGGKSIDDLEDHPAWIPQRLIVEKGGRKRDPNDRPIVDLDTLKSTPKLFSKQADIIRGYKNIPATMANATDDEVVNSFVNHVKDNLLTLHDAVPEQIRERSKLWYDGGRKISDEWASKYNVPNYAVAGTIAALSPQTDWYANVSRAERILDAVKGNGQLSIEPHGLDDFYNEFNFSPQMDARFKSVGKKGEKYSLNKPIYQPIYDMLAGTSLGDLDKLKITPKEKATAKAIWLRLYDESHNSPAHKIISPEGDFMDNVKTKDGSDKGTGWGSIVEISKGIRAAQAIDPSELSELMGEKHKVRNFYNNIISPYSQHGDVTMDTHAIAAGLLRPLSGSSLEVQHNLDSTTKGVLSAGGSNATGIRGTYPIFAEAYRQAAAERGLLPRQMQSITWEAVRGLFPDTFKRSKDSAKVEALWDQYRAGLLDRNSVINQVFDVAGASNGIRPPSWYRGESSDQSYAPIENPGEQGDLPISSLSGRPPRGFISRARGGDATAHEASQKQRSPEAQIDFDLFSAAAPVKRRQLPVSQSPIVDRALMVSSGSAPRLPGAGPLLRQLRGRPVS